MSVPNPLDRPVWVAYVRHDAMEESATVTPREMLAALGDDQRAAFVRSLLDPNQIDHRTMNAIAHGMDAPMMFTNGARSYEAQKLDRAVRAVVDAICGGRS